MTARPEQGPPPDPLIDEVGAVRQAICEQFGNDVDRLCDHLQELERQHPERLAEPSRDRRTRPQP